MHVQQKRVPPQDIFADVEDFAGAAIEETSSLRENARDEGSSKRHEQA